MSGFFGGTGPIKSSIQKMEKLNKLIEGAGFDTNSKEKEAGRVIKLAEKCLKNHEKAQRKINAGKSKKIENQKNFIDLTNKLSSSYRIFFSTIGSKPAISPEIFNLLLGFPSEQRSVESALFLDQDKLDQIMQASENEGKNSETDSTAASTLDTEIDTPSKVLYDYDSLINSSKSESDPIRNLVENISTAILEKKNLDIFNHEIKKDSDYEDLKISFKGLEYVYEECDETDSEDGEDLEIITLTFELSDQSEKGNIEGLMGHHKVERIRTLTINIHLQGDLGGCILGYINEEKRRLP